MCGIVGVFGQVGIREDRIFKDMLRVDVVRGRDSTGIAAIRPDGGADTYKNVVLPEDLLSAAAVDALFKRVNRGWIGHNRAATKGKVTVKNAHPFIFDHIVGVHNGTLSNQDLLEDGDLFESDSKAVFNHLCKLGHADMWRNLNGAAALVWWDCKKKTYNLLRNWQRPLFYATDQFKRTLYVASEAWMIGACCTRDNRNVQLSEIKSVEPHTLYSFTFTDKEGVKFSTEKLDPFVYTRQSANRWSEADWEEALGKLPDAYGRQSLIWDRKYGWVEKGDTRRHDTDNSNKATLPLPAVPSDIGGFPTVKPSQRNLSDKNISKNKFKKKYKVCTFCRCSLDGEYETAVILDAHNAVCEECVTMAEANGIALSGGM